MNGKFRVRSKSRDFYNFNSNNNILFNNFSNMGMNMMPNINVQNNLMGFSYNNNNIGNMNRTPYMNIMNNFFQEMNLLD